jgi:hypothetical protein
MVIWKCLKDAQLDQRRRTAEERERSQDRLGMGIGGNPKKGRPGQPESGVCDRRDLNRSMGELADCAVLDISLGKLIGVKVERLYY